MWVGGCARVYRLGSGVDRGLVVKVWPQRGLGDDDGNAVGRLRLGDKDVDAKFKFFSLSVTRAYNNNNNNNMSL